MKLQLFFSFYPAYLKRFYEARPGLRDESYSRQLQALLDDYFGWPPAVCRRFAERGHEVDYVIINAAPMQEAWARENGEEAVLGGGEHEIGLARVKRFGADVLWMGSMFRFFGPYLRELRRHVRKVVAWIAVDPPPRIDLGGIDLVLTSHQTFVDRFGRAGIPTERLLPAFEPDILRSLDSQPSDYDVTFVGSLSAAHGRRVEMLRLLSKEVPLHLWTPQPRLLSKEIFQRGFLGKHLRSLLLAQHSKGPVFGMDMYRVLARSKVVVNVHVEAAKGLAGNMRMFEVTGSGSLLLTDGEQNIGEIFDPDTQVVCYEDSDELIQKTKFYLRNAAEREAVARAGQERTLRNHSTIGRSVELENILGEIL